MDEKEKVGRISKIEEKMIEKLTDMHGISAVYPCEDEEKIQAIALLAKRPGKEIDEALLYATESDDDHVREKAFEALESRLLYLDSK